MPGKKKKLVIKNVLRSGIKLTHSGMALSYFGDQILFSSPEQAAFFKVLLEKWREWDDQDIKSYAENDTTADPGAFRFHIDTMKASENAKTPESLGRLFKDIFPTHSHLKSAFRSIAGRRGWYEFDPVVPEEAIRTQYGALPLANRAAKQQSTKKNIREPKRFLNK